MPDLPGISRTTFDLFLLRHCTPVATSSPFSLSYTPPDRLYSQSLARSGFPSRPKGHTRRTVAGPGLAEIRGVGAKVTEIKNVRFCKAGHNAKHSM